MNSFQFKCDSPNGFSQVVGSVSVGETGLSFEYQAKYLSLVKGEVIDLFLPYSQIGEITVEEKFFSKKLLITVNSLKSLDSFPIVEDYTISIPFPKKSSEQVREFAIKANYGLGNYRLSLLGD